MTLNAHDLTECVPVQKPKYYFNLPIQWLPTPCEVDLRAGPGSRITYMRPTLASSTMRTASVYIHEACSTYHSLCRPYGTGASRLEFPAAEDAPPKDEAEAGGNPTSINDPILDYMSQVSC